jgi:hypothetical protein
VRRILSGVSEAIHSSSTPTNEVGGHQHHWFEKSFRLAKGVHCPVPFFI